ncbi:hypothetical protein NEOLI_004203 [Neolecta irregularis DAH-3]|uniref:Gag1-like clamp domain-containing protein n=1 Tax=Neolecta irregularis (strain DAH-3) TaxID=1198029 RepID=A0A1U7LTH1_NEOID|nr:hypothetical protein NEOLI_004203 [Neolecta irregularis DAH-3]|eukprot:OLL25944.1 hypothetical protein NEOLI_004203 [Neolecta irregularis DAH-3]
MNPTDKTDAMNTMNPTDNTDTMNTLNRTDTNVNVNANMNTNTNMNTWTSRRERWLECKKTIPGKPMTVNPEMYLQLYDALIRDRRKPQVPIRLGTVVQILQAGWIREGAAS